MSEMQSSIREKRLVDATLGEAPDNTRTFYESLQGTKHEQHYKALLARFITHEANVTDALRMLIFNLHLLLFTTRRKVNKCLGEKQD